MAGGDPETTDSSPSGDKVDGAGAPKGSHPTRKDKPLPPAAKKKKAAGGRGAGENPSGGAAAGASRYTAPIPASKKGPSPRWVPVLMFALWGIGLAMILLNYMGLLPGSDDGGNGWYLIGGLGLILGGIITATQYR